MKKRALLCKGGKASNTMFFVESTTMFCSSCNPFFFFFIFFFCFPKSYRKLFTLVDVLLLGNYYKNAAIIMHLPGCH